MICRKVALCAIWMLHHIASGQLSEVISANQLPKTFRAEDVAFAIELEVSPPRVLSHVSIFSDWWMKRPKDIEVKFISGPQGLEQDQVKERVAKVVFPDSLNICGLDGEQACEYPKASRSKHIVAMPDSYEVSRVRVTVMTSDDMVIIDEVSAHAFGETTTTMPSGNVLFQVFAVGDVYCGKVPSLADKKVVFSADVPNIQIPLTAKNNPVIHGYQTTTNWAARLTAFFGVEQAGTYTFTLSLGNADTASLSVDGVELARSGCVWDGKIVGEIDLPTGVHRIQIIYADDGYNDRIVLAYTGPDTENLMVVPPTLFLPDPQAAELGRPLALFLSDPKAAELGRPLTLYDRTVEIRIGIVNVDYVRLLSHQTLRDDLKTTIRTTLATKSTALLSNVHISPEYVTVELSAGSVIVQATITLPTISSSEIDSLQSSLPNSTDLVEGLATRLQSVAGIDAVSYGRIQVSVTEVSATAPARADDSGDTYMKAKADVPSYQVSSSQRASFYALAWICYSLW